jgi:hypothetical protein
MKPNPTGLPPAKPPKKNQAFPVETVFVVMIAMNLMPRGEAIDAAHARNAALFRLTITLIGVIGLLVTFFVKRSRDGKASAESLSPGFPSQSAGPVNPWDSTAAWQGMVLTYAMTRQSAFRYEKLALKWHPTMLLSLVTLPVFASFLTASSSWNKISTAALVGKISLVFFGCMAVLVVLSVMLFYIRFPKADSVRRCVTYVSRDGIKDVTPDKTNEFEWSAISKIVETDGDLLFLPKPGQNTGCAIPREAFESVEAARRFHQAAVFLWQGKGMLQVPEEVLREFGPRLAEPVTTAASVPVLTGFDLSPD